MTDLFCAACGRRAQGDTYISRDGYKQGPTVDLCNTCGVEKSVQECWTAIRERRHVVLALTHIDNRRVETISFWVAIPDEHGGTTDTRWSTNIYDPENKTVNELQTFNVQEAAQVHQKGVIYVCEENDIPVREVQHVIIDGKEQPIPEGPVYPKEVLEAMVRAAQTKNEDWVIEDD